MAIETRTAVEELHSWVTDLEQDGVRGRARCRIRHIEGSGQTSSARLVGCTGGRVRVGEPEPLTVTSKPLPLQGLDQPDP